MAYTTMRQGRDLLKKRQNEKKEAKLVTKDKKVNDVPKKTEANEKLIIIMKKAVALKIKVPTGATYEEIVKLIENKEVK